MPPVPPPAAVLPQALLPWVWQGAGGLQARVGQRLPVVSSGHAALDAQLPGGGWPRGMLCELLVDEALSCEWRLLLPALRQVVRRGEPVFLVNPPQPPQAALHEALGCPPQHLVWVRAGKPAQAGWACEQILKSGVDAAVLAWLPRIGPAPLRRLQAVAQARLESALQAGGRDPSGCLLLVVRPAAAQSQSSPAPLRVAVGLAEQGVHDSDDAQGGVGEGHGGASEIHSGTRAAGPGGLRLHILKRRGPLHEAAIGLAALDAGLAPALAGRLARPGGLSAGRRVHERADAMGWRRIGQGIGQEAGVDAAAQAGLGVAEVPAGPYADAPAAAADAPSSVTARPTAQVVVLSEVNHAVLAGTASTPV